MASLCLVTPRDRDIFQALDRCPLTVRQLLKLSVTFAYPFTTERRVQERMRALRAAGRVRQWRYATAGQGALSYYTLAPLGYRLLHGPDAVPPGRGFFRPIGVARQGHTRALAEAVVHLLVAAHRAGIGVEAFQRENALRLTAAGESLYPDGAFELVLPAEDRRFSYFLELDNRSETVQVGSTLESWGKKVQFYERYQDDRPERFRVLLLTTGGEERLGNMLRCARDLARNPQRSLVYGIRIPDLLGSDNPFHMPAFRNHLGQPVELVSPLPPRAPVLRTVHLQSEPAMVFSPACLRPLREV